MALSDCPLLSSMSRLAISSASASSSAYGLDSAYGSDSAYASVFASISLPFLYQLPSEKSLYTLASISKVDGAQSSTVRFSMKNRAKQRKDITMKCWHSFVLSNIGTFISFQESRIYSN